MTLAKARLRVLTDEVGHPALGVGALSRVLFVTGVDGGAEPVPTKTIEAALEELAEAGEVERVWRRGGAPVGLGRPAERSDRIVLRRLTACRHAGGRGPWGHVPSPRPRALYGARPARGAPGASRHGPGAVPPRSARP